MSLSTSKKKVAIVGATGIAGQQFIVALLNHPWFEIKALGGSSRSAGKTYREALSTPDGQLGWWQSEPLNEDLGQMEVQLGTKLDLDGIDIVFSAVEAEAARVLEPLYAKHVPTISTASAFRMEDDVPLLIPGVNNEHCKLLAWQRKRRGWQGFVVPIPNCTTFGLACSLAPINAASKIEYVVMTSMQAVSGAGRHGGTLALDMVDNLVPFIAGEEEKVERETQKILGALIGKDAIGSADFGVSCSCTRVPVTDGHTEAVFVKTRGKDYDISTIIDLYRNYKTGLDELPSLPQNFFSVHSDPYHPQPRLDRDLDGGMSTHIGRIRLDPVIGGIKYVLLSHNTKAGAAKGALLVAESLMTQGLI